ncbi:MAG: helix-turn-helix transcriptional regulator [Firmicutes bacterium]|jgi:DNA-binding CsgD family transcriptional regulator|nr:helix-turn-helix transcriptional regulator [Bacillota bacterium]
MLAEKEWLFINDVIREVYAANSLRQLGEHFLLLIRKLIPFHSAIFTIIDNGYTVREQQYAAINMDEDTIREYNETYAEQDYTNEVLSFPKSTSYRDSDLIREEQKQKTDMYRNWLLPRGIKYSGGLILKLENSLIVCITIFRDDKNGMLSNRDLYILDLFIGHLEYMIKRLLIEQPNRFFDYKTMKQYAKLSQREKEIIPYVLKGYSNDDLSEVFCISQSTAKKHVYSILSKFQVASRGELIKLISSQV